MKGSRVVRDAIHMWLWWATYAVARESGSGTVAAYKAAQKATARLWK